MGEPEIIIAHAGLIDKAASIVQERINLLTPNEENTLSDEESAVRVYQIRSLKIYKRYLVFIAKELLKNDPEAAFFLLPQVRTLIDIYSKLLHLQINMNGSKDRALISIAHQLSAVHAAEASTAFDKTKLAYEMIIEGTPLAQITYEEFSFQWMKRNNFHFPSRDRLLTEENVNRYAIDARELFRGKQLHRLYAAFSEYNHGNPFYGSTEQHNERYWVISMSIQMTAYLIELIDREILNKPKKTDFRQWINEIKKNKAGLLSAWNQNRIELGKKRQQF